MFGFKINSKIDYFLGLLVAVPLSYPGPPFYLFSFLFVGLLFYRAVSRSVRVDRYSIIILFVYTLSLFLSSLLVSDGVFNIEFTALVGSTVLLVFFIFAHYVEDALVFLKGYIHGVLIVGFITILLFFIFGIYNHGVKVFYVPEYRLWARGIIPDWPNYTAFFFCFAALILTVFEKKISFPLIIIVLAALITTSRLAVLCVIFIFLMRFSIVRNVKYFVAVVCMVFLLVALYVTYGYQFDLDEQVLYRASKFNDRELLFGELLELWFERPLFGYGAASLYSISNVGYASFHNSYLEALVRGGGVGLILFVAFLSRAFFLLYKSDLPKLDKRLLFFLLLFFLISCFFQNFLKHPHIIILYSVVFSGLVNANGLVSLKYLTRR